MRHIGYFTRPPVAPVLRQRSVGAWPPAYVGAAMPMMVPQYQGLLGSVPGAGPGGAQVNPNNNADTIGQYPMGLGPQLISPTSSAGNPGPVAEVTTRVQVKYFTTTRLVIIDSTAAPAANFTIESLFVGQKSVLLNANSVPGGAFTQTATDTLLSFVTAVAGQDIVLGIANLCTASLTFQGLLIGRAVGV